MKNSAGVIIKALDTGNILLLKRSNNHESHNGVWSIPAGGIEHGENPKETVIREVWEETKIKGLFNLKYLNSISNKKTNTSFKVFYGEIENEVEPKLDEEHTDYMWVSSFDGVPKPTTKNFLKIIKDNITF